MTATAGGHRSPLVRRFSPEFFRQIPTHSGVYFFRGPLGSLLYIGKAKSLRARLRSYARLGPGQAPPHLLEMVARARRIHWVVCRNERDALEVERDLLHALRPPYNIAGTETDYYLFLAVRTRGKKSSARLQLDLELTDHPELSAGTRLFGCFNHRGPTKNGYAALLRLLFAAHFRGPRFHYPAAISTTRPPYRYQIELHPEWLPALRAFLSGRSLRFLRLLSVALVENEKVPSFMRYSLQRDLNAARGFFRMGPAATRKMRLVSGATHRRMVSAPLVLAPRMDQLLLDRLARRFPNAGLENLPAGD